MNFEGKCGVWVSETYCGHWILDNEEERKAGRRWTIDRCSPLLKSAEYGYVISLNGLRYLEHRSSSLEDADQAVLQGIELEKNKSQKH